MDDDRLLQEFYNQGGDAILRCIQCGTCSGSCPLGQAMDRGPREIFALLKDSGRSGAVREVLQSTTLWFCVSCYACQVRCPQEIPVTDLLYALKRLAVKHGLAAKRHKLPDLYAAFAKVVEAGGRLDDSRVMARYSLKHPADAVRSLPLALQMALRGRLKPAPQKMADPARVRGLLNNLESPEDTGGHP